MKYMSLMSANKAYDVFFCETFCMAEFFKQSISIYEHFVHIYLDIEEKLSLINFSWLLLVEYSAMSCEL